MTTYATHNGSPANSDREVTNKVLANPSRYADFYKPGGAGYGAGAESILYHTSAGGSGSFGKSGSGSGRRGGRGGGSGGSGRTKLNLKVYQRGKWDTGGLKKNAYAQADAQNREAYAASKRARMDAENNYQRSIRELELNRERDTRHNAEARDATLAANSNTALNRGMGFGNGYLQTQTNARTGYDNQLNDLIDQYIVQSAGFAGDRNNIYAQMDEQDRVTAANRQALIASILESLTNSSFGRYTGMEGLRQNEIDSANKAIAARVAGV